MRLEVRLSIEYAYSLYLDKQGFESVMIGEGT